MLLPAVLFVCQSASVYLKHCLQKEECCAYIHERRHMPTYNRPMECVSFDTRLYCGPCFTLIRTFVAAHRNRNSPSL